GDSLFVNLAPRIMAKLHDDFGELSKLHQAAILGNLGHECAGFTQMHQIGGGDGLGWAQWSGERHALFVAELAGRPPDDFDANYGFLKKELKGSHKAAIAALLPTGDIHSAVVAFERKFEAASDDAKHYESRERYAQIALSL